MWFSGTRREGRATVPQGSLGGTASLSLQRVSLAAVVEVGKGWKGRLGSFVCSSSLQSFTGSSAEAVEGRRLEKGTLSLKAAVLNPMAILCLSPKGLPGCWQREGASGRRCRKACCSASTEEKENK